MRFSIKKDVAVILGIVRNGTYLSAIVRILRHSRVGGNPAFFAGLLDSRLRGNDGMLSFCGISSELIE